MKQNNSKKKIFILFSIFTLLIVSVLVIVFVFSGNKKDKKDTFEYKDKPEKKIEIEYENTRKKLMDDFFKKKENEGLSKIIEERVKMGIKNKKEKIKDEENSEEAWKQQLLKENVFSEENLYEKLKYVYQNETFYDIFFNKTKDELFKEYVKSKNPVHLVHFALKINNDKEYKPNSKISSIKAKKISDITTKMETSNDVSNNFEKIKNILNLDSQDEIDKIDESFIDYNSLLKNETTKDEEFKSVILLNKNKIKIHKIPYELFFLLNNQKYDFQRDQDDKILDIKTEEQCILEKCNQTLFNKYGFAENDLLPKDTTKIKNTINTTKIEDEDFLIRNVLFNKYFRYGFSQINNEILKFNIDIQTVEQQKNTDDNNKNKQDDKQKKYYVFLTESDRQKKADRSINNKDINENFFLFYDNQKIHFLNIIHNFSTDLDFKKAEEYIEKISNGQNEKYIKRNVFKKKIRNFDVVKIQQKSFEYLVNQTIQNKEEQRQTIEKFQKMFENKIKSNEILENLKIQEKIEKYEHSVNFEKENQKNDKLFYKLSSQN